MAYYNPYSFGNNMYQQNMQPNTSYGYAQTSYQNAYPQASAGINPGCKWAIDFVLGEVAAKAYPVQAGQIAVLMDSEESCFYMKAADQYGMPQPLRKFRFVEETAQSMNGKNLMMNSNDQQSQQSQQNNDYITKEEFETRLKERLEELMK